ncbi:DUF4176 domain-containing protein [Leifsonia shinshuensis]|nr:DUF4176 domain-containing protein [Leifsonia shinshuensis]
MVSLELQGGLLGLGSIVRLETPGVSGLFVVLARGAFRPDKERTEVVPRYLVAPHPFGEAPDQETFPILVDAIQQVVFEGYTDDADTSFLENLLDQMENGRRVMKPEANHFAESLTAIPEVSDDAGGGDAAGNPRDPFFELRRLASKDRGKKP